MRPGPHGRAVGGRAWGWAVVDTAAAEAVQEPNEEFVHPIFRIAPGEDVGSDTAGNYRYQAEVAAQACLAMLTEERIEYVVCEWHEDFVIAFADGSVELVSVKHRRTSRGPWNVPDLCKSGGLAHLFDRWRACDGAGNVRLRLATNAGLTTGKTGALTLAHMCGPDPEVIDGVDDMSESIARYFLRTRWKQPYDNIPEVPQVTRLADITVPTGFTDMVKGFLAVLEFDAGLPARQHITDVNLQSLLVPAIVHMQREHVDSESTYRNLVERIEKANRDESDRGQLAAYIADPRRVRNNVRMQQRIGRRTLYRTTVLGEFVSNNAAVPTYARGQLPIVAPGGANLRRKLARGHVPSDEATHAERLRSAWYVTWSQHRSGLAGDTTDLTNLSLEVVDTVFECRGQADNEVADGRPYGRRMNQLITQRLTPENISATLPFPANSQHLRGLAYQICDDCDFYFSDPFTASADEAS